MRIRTSVFGGWLLLLSASALASARDGDFERGVHAFKNADYATAVAYFESARNAGVDTPALHYNLGASLYKLGRYAEAEAAFGRAATDPAWHDLAYYNMGLAAHARGDAALAARYFEEAARADAESVRALAANMLERLGIPSTRTYGSFAADVGYDDNVTLTANNQPLQTTREADTFLQLYGTATGRLALANNRLRWDASLYTIRYDTLTENNLTEFAAGVTKPGTAGEWKTDIGAEGAYLWVGGNRFQRAATLVFAAGRALPGDRDLRVRLRLSAIDALDDAFDFLSGTRQELEVSLAEPLGRGRVRSGITFEHNDRRDFQTADDFYSYSPTRLGAWVTGSWPLGADWRLEPSAIYYYSRYADTDRRASGFAARREDTRLLLGVRARYRLGSDWRAIAQYTLTHNDSNIDEFSYAQRIVSLGVLRPF